MPATSKACKISGMTIGNRIRIAREQKGLSQAELGRSVGVKAQSVQQWESGMTAPRQQRVEKIASVLGVSANWIFTGGGPQQPPEMTEDNEYTVAINRDELTLLEKYRRMDDEERDVIQHVGYLFADKPRTKWTGIERRLGGEPKPLKRKEQRAVIIEGPLSSSGTSQKKERSKEDDTEVPSG